MTRLIIFGAGGYGRTIADVAEQTNKYDSILFLDDNNNGEDVVGTIVDFPKYIDNQTCFYPAIGDNQKRIELIGQLRNAKASIATIIHHSAYVSPKAIVSLGSAVLPGAIVNTNVTIGTGCIVNVGAIIDHGSVLEEGVHIAPGAIVKGENRIPAYSKIDSGTVVEARSMKL